MISLRSEKVLTGHMHKGSAYETATGCGNCDGANCDYCNCEYRLYNKDSNELLFSFNPTQASILKQLTEPRDDHYGYYEIDFTCNSIMDSAVVKLHSLLNRLFMFVSMNHVKSKNCISCKIILANDDVDMKWFIESKLEQEEINEFKIIRMQSSNPGNGEILPENKVRMNVFTTDLEERLQNGYFLYEPRGYIICNGITLYDKLENAYKLLNWKTWADEKPDACHSSVKGCGCGAILQLEDTDKFFVELTNGWKGFDSFKEAHGYITRNWKGKTLE